MANKAGRRAEPANTPLVEQAPMALVFVGRGLVGPEQRALASEDGQRGPTGKAEQPERVTTLRERKLGGCGKLF